MHGDSDSKAKKRSISIVPSGSVLIIHEDERYAGGHGCQTCKFGKDSPCRIQNYYRGPIEDCKLWNRTNPAEFLEIRDLRDPEDRFGTATSKQPSTDSRFLDAMAQARRYQEAGESLKEAKVLREAVAMAPDPTVGLAVLVRAARSLLEAGRHHEAYRLLTMAEDRAREARQQEREDKTAILEASSLREYEATLLLLREELGGYVGGGKTLRTPFGRRLESVLTVLREGVGGGREGATALFHELEEKVLRSEIDLPGRLWLYQQYLSWGRDAERIPKVAAVSKFETEVRRASDRLELDVIHLRLESQQGGPIRVMQRFLKLWPQLGSITEGGRHLAALGFVAESLLFHPNPPPATCRALAAEIQGLYRELLHQQLGSSGRRRLRQRSQRALEACLGALYQAAKSPHVEEDERACCHREAWNLIVATRNPELQFPRELEEELSSATRSAEDSLHRGLYFHLMEGRSRAEFVDRFLERITDIELAGREIMDVVPSEPAGKPPANTPVETDVMIAWFECRELHRAGRLWVLGNFGDLVTMHFVDPLEPMLDRLLRWWRGERAKSTVSRSWLRLRRDAVRHCEPGPELDPIPDDEVRHLVGQLFPADLLCNESSDITLLPDGGLYVLPIELFPLPASGSEALQDARRIGERFILSQALRPNPLRRQTPIDLSRGWLGLGAAPAQPEHGPPIFDVLAGTLEELHRIQNLLREQTIDTEVLTEEQATPEELRKALLRTTPAILHIAAHGHGDTEFPDACALILAIEVGGASACLLPFRDIRRLPLKGVELVVLSACSSLVGRPGIGTGMEGLAWGFLEAGAAQVLASRYPVGDAETCRLMEVLYHHLLGSTPAKALARTRSELLKAGDFPEQELGAWVLVS